MFLIIILFLMWIFTFLIIISNSFYCYVFCHKEWKIYNELNKLDDFEEYTKYSLFRDFKTKSFPDYTIHVIPETLESFVWNEPLNKLVAYGFYTKGSKKLTNKLLNYDKN